METISCFHIFVSGQIECVNFPLGPDGSEVFCRYEIVAGSDWELISGLKAGITQCSKSRIYNENIVFNMPLEFSFKATNAFGWPQILFSIYGKNFWGAETLLGYARIHVPIFGSGEQKLKAPILIPKSAHLLSEVASWISGKNPELKNPKILLEGANCKNLQFESYGELTVILQTISRGANRMNYEWEGNSNENK